MLEVKSGSRMRPGHRQQPAGVAATEYYKSLMAFSPPDTLNYFWDDVMALMQQGKVAELIMWNDATYAVAVDETRLDGRRQDGLRHGAAGRGRQGRLRSRAGPISSRLHLRTRRPPISSSSG